jgi:transcription elongation factor GreB
MYLAWGRAPIACTEMGRWRPPPAKSSPYITPGGFDALQNELKLLWVRRADVVKALSAAAAEGDRSENAEYIYRKKELGGLDRRIRYLQKRLPVLTIVRETPQPDRVFFGAWVRLEKEDGNKVEYRIVGPDETSAAENSISIDSPLARALLKKSVDDEISLTLESGTQELVIIDIRYE